MTDATKQDTAKTGLLWIVKNIFGTSIRIFLPTLTSLFISIILIKVFSLSKYYLFFGLVIGFLVAIFLIYLQIKKKK